MCVYVYVFKMQRCKFCSKEKMDFYLQKINSAHNFVDTSYETQSSWFISSKRLLCLTSKSCTVSHAGLGK